MLRSARAIYIYIIAPISFLQHLLSSRWSRGTSDHWPEATTLIGEMDGGGGETYGYGGGRREGGWAWLAAAAAAADGVFRGRRRRRGGRRGGPAVGGAGEAADLRPSTDGAAGLAAGRRAAEVNVRRLAADEQRALLERVAGVADDHAGFLCMFKERLDR